MGARIAMMRLAKMNRSSCLARRLDFTIGIASGERRVPATWGGYAREAWFCQRHGWVAINPGDGVISDLCWAPGRMRAMA